MKIQEIMSSPVVCVREEDNLATARETMLSRGVTKLPVLDAAGAVTGLLTKRSLLSVESSLLRSGRALDLRAGEVMARRPPAVAPGRDVLDVAGELRHRAVSAAVVERDKEVLGIATEADVVGALAGRLAGRAVSEWMTRDPVTAPRHASLSSLLSRFREEGIHQVVVTEGRPLGPPLGGLVGIVTMRDVLFGPFLERRENRPRAPPAPGRKRVHLASKSEPAGRPGWRQVLVLDGVAEDVMTRDLLTVPPGRDAGAATRQLASARINALPVVEDDGLLGIFTRADALRALVSG